MADENLFNQEEVNKIVTDRLNRQKEINEKELSNYKAENKKLEARISELTNTIETSVAKYKDYDKNISDLNAKIADYETANLRTRIALENGLPYDLASRLVGNDEETITADAKKLSELVKHKEPVAPLKDTEPKVNSEDEAYKNLLNYIDSEGE